MGQPPDIHPAIALLLLVPIFFSLVPLTAQTKLKVVNRGIIAQSQTDTRFTEVLNLLKQANEKKAAGQLDEAIVLAERAVQLAEKSLGPEHPTVTMSLAFLAQLYEQKHDDKRAETIYLRALAVAEKPTSG